MSLFTLGALTVLSICDLKELPVPHILPIILIAASLSSSDVPITSIGAQVKAESCPSASFSLMLWFCYIESLV